MKTWTVEYTTNLEDRHTATVKAETYTMAYARFSITQPDFIIVSIKERN